MIYFLIIVTTLLATGQSCYMTDCASGYHWGKRNRETPQRPLDYRTETEGFLNIEKEFQQCFEVSLSKKWCGIIDSGACCSVIEGQGLACDLDLAHSNSKPLVCKSVKNKLRRSLENYMRETDVLYNGVQCCIDATSCCFNADPCKARISCTFKESSRSLTNEKHTFSDLMKLLNRKPDENIRK